MIPASDRWYAAITEQRITLPENAELARHAADAIARHSRRGWGIDKPTPRTHIDGIIALRMALERAEFKPEPVELVGWLLTPCLDCGRLAKGSRCRICIATRNRANPYRDAAWRRLSRQVVARDGSCVRCGSAGPYLAAHHVRPRADGGPDALENLVTLCASCHGRLEAQQRVA